MKARINYKSKKTIAIIAIIILLVITATVGTIAYIKNNNDSTAATENVTTENAASENTGENNAQEKQQNENNDNNNQNANTNSASSLGNGTGTSNPSNTANSSTNTGSNVNTNNNANSTSTNNNANAISTNNNANSTSTNNGNGITNTPNSEYTQTTIIPGTEKILVSEDTKIGWSPIMVNAEMPLADIYKANLKLSKIAFVNDDRNQTAAQKGETITYIIRVENPTDIEAKNIYAYDTIPEGTTLVENSIDNNGKNKDNKIEWKIESIKPKETIEVSFKVLVKDEKIDVIKNKATVNGNTTEEVKTPIIKTKKVAKIVSKSSDGNEVLLDRDAKVGEKIRYIISAKNDSEADGQTVITDSIPENAELVEGSISEGGSISDGKITWSNVKVGAGKTTEVSFDVIVGNTNESIKNKAIIGNTPTDEVDTKVANIVTEKTSKKISKDGKEIKDSENLHELDFIEYSLKVTNKGNGEGTAIIKDTVPTGTKIEGKVSLTGDTKNYSETELNKGIEVKLNSNETRTITFKVKVQPFTDKTENVQMVNNVATLKIRNAEAKQDDKDVPPTEDLVEKEYSSIKGTKTWIDPEGTVHPEITINLLQDGKEIKETKLANGETTYSFDHLDKYDLANGHTYEYTTSEDNVEGYTSRRDGNDYTNTINQVKISVSGNKTWIAPKEIVHPEITINLLQDGKEIKEIKLANGKTEYSFDNLDKYDLTDGHAYKYTVSEDKVNGYTTKQEGNNFTNTIEQDTSVKVEGKKKWIDPKGTVHPDITINLLRDGTKVATRTLTNGKTTYSFDNLDKYDLKDGHIYEYTTSEDPVEGYTTEKNGNDYTNTINQDNSTVIGGTKTWIAPKDIQHPNITINLLRDGKKVDSRTLKNGTESYKFTNLDKYASDGHIYEYTTSEEPVEGYTSRKDENNYINTINQEKISVNGNKTWIDPTGTTHPDVTINLLRDGTKVATRTLTNGVTTYSFDNLDKSDLKDGHIYEYTTSEDPLEGYTSVKNGNNYTNTINQKIISISGTKTWIGPAATAETRPTVTINLYRNDEFLTSTKLQNNGTTYSFTELDKYDLKTGKEYEYRVEEAENNNLNYTSEKLADSNGKMYNFKNTIKQVNDVNVKITKKWIDPTGTTHPTITINLYRDNDTTPFKTHELTNGNTEYTFEKLERYDLTTGKEHIYRVEEATKLDDYQDPVITNTSNTNFTIVNRIAQKQINVEVTKNWIGAPNNSKYPTITIKLHKNSKDGEIVGTKTLTNENREATQKVTFDGLDEYDLTTGEKIKYYVTEDPVKNYDVTYNQDTKTITNTYNQDIKGEITKKQIVTTESTDTAPLDVVFVLDVSGSMEDNNKGSNMVSAVNSAMNTILNSNSENKVGIVTFSDSSSTLLPLGRYTANSNSEYLKYPLYSDRIETNLKNWNYSYKAISGGTYTQSGIKAGADMLMNNSNTTYKAKNGETRSRIPLIILVTDGEPTYYATAYDTLNNRIGNGTQTTGTYGYYTIKTANYYKQQVQQYYFKNNDGGAKFYTIGTGMSGEFAKAVLDPSAENIKATNKGGSDDKRKQLYNLITEKNEINSLDYADASATGSFSSEQLTKLMNDFIKSNSVETTTRKITEEESNSRKVIIGDMDFETENALKEFKLIVNGTEYNTKSSAMQSGYLKQNATDGYYLDFSSIPDGNNVSFTMTYYKPEVIVKD